MGRQAATLPAQDGESELCWPPAPATDPVVLSPEPFGGALRPHPPGAGPARTGRLRGPMVIAGLGAVIAAAAFVAVGQFGVPASRASIVAEPVTVVAKTGAETGATETHDPALVRPSTERAGTAAPAGLAEGLDALRAQMRGAAQAPEAARAPRPDLASADEPGLGWRPVSGIAAPAAPASPAVTEPVAARPGPAAAEVGALLERARGLIATGDIAAARRLAEYAAGGDDGDALFALAETYDPAQLARWHVRGVRADPEKARALYRRALDRGVAGAKARLAGLP